MTWYLTLLSRSRTTNATMLAPYAPLRGTMPSDAHASAPQPVHEALSLTCLVSSRTNLMSRMNLVIQSPRSQHPLPQGHSGRIRLPSARLRNLWMTVSAFESNETPCPLWPFRPPGFPGIVLRGFLRPRGLGEDDEEDSLPLPSCEASPPWLILRASDGGVFGPVEYTTLPLTCRCSSASSRLTSQPVLAMYPSSSAFLASSATVRAACLLTRPNDSSRAAFSAPSSPCLLERSSCMRYSSS